MEMRKFMNYEEEELINFIKQDDKTIKIRFITESDYITKIYYDEIKRVNSAAVFGTSMFNFRQISSPYDPSSIFHRSETPVSASSRNYLDRQSNR